MREKYESLAAAVLKELAKSRGIKITSTMKKADVVEAMLAKDEEEKGAATKPEASENTSDAKKEDKKSSDGKKAETADKTEKPKTAKKEKVSEKSEDSSQDKEAKDTKESKDGEENADPFALSEDKKDLDSGVKVEGILEILQEGYGFIRSNGYLPGEKDVYVAPSQIRRFGLRTGDYIVGNTRIKTTTDKFDALLFVDKVNGISGADIPKRPSFENLTPVFPYEKLVLERPGCSVAMRAMDLFCPIGKGQRGMIVSPPKAGKTTLLKDVAKSILANNPKMRIIILLIDERPEEVTDIKEAIVGDQVDVVYSTFDELPDHHKRVSEMVIERARRLVELGQEVTILLDSITRLSRAYNLTVPPSGRTLSGGLDPAALHMPKRFFGAARKMREGGSLTILATALIDTGSKMDDVVYEEFKGTGNMEMILDRKLSEKRIFPAIDIPRSGTRRDDLLLNPQEQQAMQILRKGLNGLKPDETVERILDMLSKTRTNREFCDYVQKRMY